MRRIINIPRVAVAAAAAMPSARTGTGLAITSAAAFSTPSRLNTRIIPSLPYPPSRTFMTHSHRMQDPLVPPPSYTSTSSSGSGTSRDAESIRALTLEVASLRATIESSDRRSEAFRNDLRKEVGSMAWFNAAMQFLILASIAWSLTLLTDLTGHIHGIPIVAHLVRKNEQEKEKEGEKGETVTGEGELAEPIITDETGSQKENRF